MSKKHKTRRYRPLVEMLEERINPSVELGFAHAIGGNREDLGRAAAVDDAGNVYVAGKFNAGLENIVDFDPGPEKAEFEDDDGEFVAKYNRNGDLEWVTLWATILTGSTASP